MLQANIRIVQTSNNVFRLFCHEAQRVFHDRLISDEDKAYFYQMLSDISHKHFHEVSEKKFNSFQKKNKKENIL